MNSIIKTVVLLCITPCRLV